MTDVLAGRLDDDRSFDVVDGAAGCIGSLLALHAVAPAAATLDLATRCGDHLLGHARSMPHGIGWIPERADTPLAGFAHGAAGIAWALLKLAAATGERRFRTAALEAIAYERSLFSPEAQNWPDLRAVERRRRGRTTDADDRLVPRGQRHRPGPRGHARASGR